MLVNRKLQGRGHNMIFESCNVHCAGPDPKKDPRAGASSSTMAGSSCLLISIQICLRVGGTGYTRDKGNRQLHFVIVATTNYSPSKAVPPNPPPAPRYDKHFSKPYCRRAFLFANLTDCMGSSRPTIQCNGRAGQWRVLQEGLLGPPSPTRPGVGGSSAFFSIAAISAACGVFMTLTALSVVSSLQTSPFRTEIGLDPLLTFLRDDRSSLADLPKGVFGQAMLIGPSAHGKLCQSLTLAQEVGTRRSWIPPPVCEDYLRAYVRSGQYRLDFAVAVHFIEEALLGGPIKGDGTDMVVLDIDETALSNLEYYKKNRYGTTPYNVTLWNEWVLQAEAQPYEPMLRMYERLQSSNWTFAFVTGRDESQRTATEHNLHAAGFRNWTDLILRTEEQLHLPAATYKSQARAKLETAGYTLWGNIGDQWSDLEGYSTGVRTFKLPNPFYFVP